MIERLQVRGFKSLLDVDVQLGPLTVLVGANGSGKTSVLEAIATLRPRSAAFDRASSYQEWFQRHQSRQSPSAIEIDVLMPSEGIMLSLQCNHEEGSQLVSRLEGNVAIVVSKNVPEARSRFSSFARRVAIYRLDASAMSEPSYSDDLDPRLSYDGENLATVLDTLQGTHRERFDEIERRMRALVPPLRRLRVPRAKTGRAVGHQVAFDFEHAADIRADDASEGTLLLLGLLTIIESSASDQPMTIMLDDLDRALHPQAQRELVGYLHELIRTRPGLQIIATTHSPYLVEHLEFEEVRAITLAPDGTSVIGSLTDHPEAERWREEMSAGEFWSAVGESWVAEKRSGT